MLSRNQLAHYWVEFTSWWIYLLLKALHYTVWYRMDIFILWGLNLWSILQSNITSNNLHTKFTRAFGPLKTKIHTTEIHTLKVEKRKSKLNLCLIFSCNWSLVLIPAEHSRIQFWIRSLLCTLCTPTPYIVNKKSLPYTAGSTLHSALATIQNFEVTVELIISH